MESPSKSKTESNKKKQEQAKNWVVGKILEYDRQAKNIVKQIKRLKKQKVQFAKQYQYLINMDKNYEKEEELASKKLLDSDALLKAFRGGVEMKKRRFREQFEALNDLETNINSRISEVENKISNLEEAILEWHAANTIVSDLCKTATYHATDKFNKWHQISPILQTWLSNESRVHDIIYNTASLIGMTEEIRGQEEFKKKIQEFCDKYYKDVSLRNELPTTKKLYEQRQMRSEAIDQFYWDQHRQLQNYLRQCDRLEGEIIERESIRSKLNAIAMELNNYVTEDYRNGIQFCEDEARRPLDQIMEALKLAVEEAPDIVPQTLLEQLRESATSNLEKDILDIATLATVNKRGSQASLNEQSMMSSLSGTSEMFFAGSLHQQSLQGPSVPVLQESTTFLSFQKHFEDVKKAMKKNKTCSFAKSILPEVRRLVDSYDSSVRKSLSTAKNLEEDFSQHSSEYSNDFHNDEIKNIVETNKQLKALQRICAKSSFEAINMLSNLLDKVRFIENAKGANTGVPAQANIDYEHQAHAKELVDKVSRAFTIIRPQVEKWLFSDVLTSYNDAQKRFERETEKCGLYSDEAMMEMEFRRNINSRIHFESETVTDHPIHDSFSANSTPFAIPSLHVARTPEGQNFMQGLDDSSQQQDSFYESNNKFLAETTFADEKSRKTVVSRGTVFSPNESRRSRAATILQSPAGNPVTSVGPSEEGDQQLGKVEIIMRAELYYMTLVWRPSSKQIIVTAVFLQDKEYRKEYQIMIDLEVFSGIMGTHLGWTENFILNETQKALQVITHHMQVEYIDRKYYETIIDLLEPCAEDFTNLTTVPNIQDFLPSAIHATDQVKAISKQEKEELEALEFGYLMNVLTFRGNQGGLLYHCFPTKTFT